MRMDDLSGIINNVNITVNAYRKTGNNTFLLKRLRSLVNIINESNHSDNVKKLIGDINGIINDVVSHHYNETDDITADLEYLQESLNESHTGKDIVKSVDKEKNSAELLYHKYIDEHSDYFDVIAEQLPAYNQDKDQAIQATNMVIKHMKEVYGADKIKPIEHLLFKKIYDGMT